MPSASPDWDRPRCSLNARILRPISMSSAPARRFLFGWDGSLVKVVALCHFAGAARENLARHARPPADAMRSTILDRSALELLCWFVERRSVLSAASPLRRTCVFPADFG